MAQIRNRFKQLLAQIETETGARPTYDEIQQETGIAASTLSAYAQGKVTRYDESTLVALVDYFDKKLSGGCSLSDFLEYPPVNGQELSYATMTA
jgi:hypothetical protein